MKHKSLLLLIFVLLLIIVVLLAVLFCGEPEQEAVHTSGLEYEASGNSEELSIKETLPNIIIPGWTGIRLHAGSTTASVSLHNPDANKDYYDLTFSLRLVELGTEIFTTGLVAPGEKCTSVTLLQELEPGEYPAKLFVQPYLRDEIHTPLNNAELEILLIVE